MKSPYSLLYLAIMQKLAKVQVIRKAEPEPAYRQIDQELGQLENYRQGTGERPPVAWPCALIDIGKGRFNDQLQKVQDGIVTVTIRIGFDPYSSSSNLTPAQSRNKALFYYELEQATYELLHCWSPGKVAVSDEESVDITDLFTKMTRKAFDTEDRTDLIRVRVMTFQIGVTDTTAKKPITMAPVNQVNVSGDILLSVSDH